MNYRIKILANLEEKKKAKKASSEIIDFTRNKYFETVGSFKTTISDILKKYGFDTTDFDDWNIIIYSDNPDLGVTEEDCNIRKVFQISPKINLVISIYRRPTGRYEVTAYIAY